MSKASNSSLGFEHGKIGDRIAVVQRGKQIYKKLYKPTNPRTPKQQMHRAKLAFINRLSAQMAEAINLGYAMVPELKEGISPRNAFAKKNWDNGALVWNEEEGAWGLCPDQLKLADGPLFIDENITAEVKDGLLYIHCPNPGLTTDSHTAEDDQLHVALYLPAASRLIVKCGPYRKNCKECWLELPEECLKEDVTTLVYVWFEASSYHRGRNGHLTIRPSQASTSLFLGAF